MFYVSKTFSQITPESAECGDYSDSGFIHDTERFTLSELLHEISNHGFVRQGSTDWLETYWETQDYATGSEEQLCLHIDRKLSSKRAIALWDSFK